MYQPKWVVLTILALLIITTNMSPVAASSGAGPEMLKRMEAEFMRAAANKGSAGYMSYYAAEAVELPNGAEAIKGKDNIAKTMGFLDQTGNKLEWTPEFADLSGDLGYTYGTFIFSSKDKDGKFISETGKYTSIWKKQKDGTWKVVLDMGNASKH